MAIVKCAVCGNSFNREKEKCVKYSARRYAHYDCFPEGDIVYDPAQRSQDEIDLEELKNYINKIFNQKVNWALVMKQISTFKNDNGYTYNGMLKTLYWWHEIKKNPIDSKINGIGIIPFQYQAAYDYFYKIYNINKINMNKKTSLKPDFVEIKSPRTKVKIKLFDLGDDNDEI